MAVPYPTGARQNYQGKLLVAHPMLDEYFHRTVILIYQDDPKNGTVGLVLNKPTKITVSDVIADRGIAYGGTEHVYRGGPVNETAILMLHEDNWYSSNTIHVSRGLSISSDDIMMEKLAMGNQPLAWRMCMGVAGWHPGQLQKELNSKYGWLTCDADSSIVFAKDGERQWNQALQKCANQTIDSYF
jgi:putative transcriptional regulator